MDWELENVRQHWAFCTEVSLKTTGNCPVLEATFNVVPGLKFPPQTKFQWWIFIFYFDGAV